jgi:hypothetical protein
MQGVAQVLSTQWPHVESHTSHQESRRAASPETSVSYQEPIRIKLTIPRLQAWDSCFTVSCLNHRGLTVTPQAFRVSECPAATFWNKLGARGLVFAFKCFFAPQHYEFYAQRDSAGQRDLRTLEERTEFDRAGNQTVQRGANQVSRDAPRRRPFIQHSRPKPESLSLHNPFLEHSRVRFAAAKLADGGVDDWQEV